MILNPGDNLTLVSIIVTAVGSVAAVIGIAFVWFQVRASQQIAKGEFLLHLAELLRAHDPAYQVLMTTTDWEPEKAGVSALDMENYMSLFEQFKILIDYGIIDLEVFDRLYGYRIILIVVNDWIHQHHLGKNAVGWPDFIQLAQMVAERRRNQEPTAVSDVWHTRWRVFIDRADKLKVVR